MNEKAYKAMNFAGISGIVVGIVVAIVGVTAGVITIVGGVFLPINISSPYCRTDYKHDITRKPSYGIQQKISHIETAHLRLGDDCPCRDWRLAWQPGNEREREELHNL